MAVAIIEPPLARKVARILQIRASHAWLAACLLLAVWYLGGPLMTLWRVERAVRVGDVSTLQSLIDWNGVRQGLKQDVAEGLLGVPQHAASDGKTLPPFGASFMNGIAGSAIDRDVTPQTLLAAGALLGRPVAGLNAIWGALRGAAFSAPDTFDLRLLTPGQGPDEEPLHVRLQFRHWQWRVVRVWVPQDLMDEASASPT